MASTPVSDADKWRRFWRTFLQALISFSIVGPFIPPVLEQFVKELPEGDAFKAIGPFLITAGLVLAAIAALISRLMLIPAVNGWLTKIGLGAGVVAAPVETEVEEPVEENTPDDEIVEDEEPVEAPDPMAATMAALEKKN